MATAKKNAPRLRRTIPPHAHDRHYAACVNQADLDNRLWEQLRMLYYHRMSRPMGPERIVGLPYDLWCAVAIAAHRHVAGLMPDSKRRSVGLPAGNPLDPGRELPDAVPVDLNNVGTMGSSGGSDTTLWFYPVIR